MAAIRGLLFYSLVISINSVCLGQSTSVGIGRCPKMPYMKNFNLTRFTGQWFEIERSFSLFQVISSCVSVDLSQNRRGQLEVAVMAKRWSESLTVSEGLASQTRRDPSILLYKVVSDMPKIVNRYLPGAGYYQVLDTDYDNYAVLWSCTSYVLAYTDLIWIWGRQRELNADQRAYIYDFLTERKLDSERLILPKNSNCTD